MGAARFRSVSRGRAALALLVAMPITELLTGGPEAVFALRNVPPPSAHSITADDLLALTSFNSHTSTKIEVRARIMSPRGKVGTLRLVHTPNTDRTAKQELFAMQEGYLLGLAVVPTASDVQRGQTFVQVGLTRGGGPNAPFHQLFVQDYISSKLAGGWPGGDFKTSVEGRGVVRVIAE